MHKKILIIEKDINFSHSLQTQFLIVGMDVMILEDKDEEIEIFLARIEKFSPDYIVIDLSLGNFEPFELIRSIKNKNASIKFFSYLRKGGDSREKMKDYNLDYCYSADEMTVNQFALRTIKIINNQEKLKQKNNNQRI